jgi:hypothetical protein
MAVNEYLIYRSTTRGNRPAVGAQPFGTPYINFADMQFGVIDSTQTPQDLIGVPIFSAAQNYSTGQPVNYLGQVYVALSTVTAGAWVPAQWSLVASQSWFSSQGSASGGFINKIRNPKMSIWQRGTGVTSPIGGGFGADGWICGNLGAACNVSRVQGLNTLYSMQIAGAPGMTSLFYRTHMEASETCSLGGKAITFQAQFFNSTGGTITPVASLYHPNAVNNFPGGTTNDFTTTLQNCPNNTWTRIACTWILPILSAEMGLGIDLTIPAMTVNTQTIRLSEVDLRATPGLVAGLNSNPPSPEFRSDWIEYLSATHYYWALGSPALTDGYAYAGGSQITPDTYFFPCGFMFATPTVAYTVSSTSNVSSAQVIAASALSGYPLITGTAAGPMTAQFANVVFVAEL